MNILLLTSLTFIIIHLHCFRCFDILHIPKPSNKFFLPWGFVFLACCQVSEQSEEKLLAETRQQPNDGTAAAASKVAPCGGMWVDKCRLFDFLDVIGLAGHQIFHALRFFSGPWTITEPF